MCKGKDYKKAKDDLSGQITNETKELKKLMGKYFLQMSPLLVQTS